MLIFPPNENLTLRLTFTAYFRDANHTFNNKTFVMGKHQKSDRKLLHERPEVVAILQHIEETVAALEMLKAEKEAMKASLKEAKKLLKKQLKAKPEKKKAEKDKATKPKPAVKPAAKKAAVKKLPAKN